MVDRATAAAGLRCSATSKATAAKIRCNCARALPYPTSRQSPRYQMSAADPYRKRVLICDKGLDQPAALRRSLNDSAISLGALEKLLDGKIMLENGKCPPF